MSRLPDLILDWKLETSFRNSNTVHIYPDIDAAGRRFSREEHWKQEQLIGRGGFGFVRRERCITEGTKLNLLRAVKIIEKPPYLSSPPNFNRELEAIAKFSHDRYRRWFVKSFGWYETTDSIFIAMEYCRHGDLDHYLQSHPVLHVEKVQQITYQILEGLDYMHKSGFAHRDLKPGVSIV